MGSADLASRAQWAEFGCRFSRLGDVYVGSDRNPYPGLGWRFVQLAARAAGTTWGVFVVFGLGEVWHKLERNYKWYVYTRVDMHWLFDPQQLLTRVRFHHLQSSLHGASPSNHRQRLASAGAVACNRAGHSNT